MAALSPDIFPFFNRVHSCLYGIQTVLLVKKIMQLINFLIKILWLYNIH